MTVERKFTASRHRLEEALCVLRQFGIPDPRFPTGLVRNIYLDSPRFFSYAEKVNGDFLKTKIRLRWYGASDDPVPVFLEIKSRSGAGREKKRLKFALRRDWLESVSLDDPALLEQIQSNAGELRADVPDDYAPVLGLRYIRHRFVCALTGARVCLDSNIEVDRLNGRLFPSLANPELPEIVFEFKDIVQTEIPWLGELAHAGFLSRSFSKYGECVRRVLEGGAPL